MIVQLVVATGNRTGQTIPVCGSKFIIGRAEDCHMRPQSELISRYHCTILVGDKVVVRDLGSKNGVRLNGEKVNTEQTLYNGDRLTIGPLEFYLHIDPDADTSAELLAVSPSAGGQQPTEEENASVGPGGYSTILLNHLKTLNLEEHADSEQPTSPLKKIL
jgi:pSer/pThr/pTyr-binding forkhead associated (FHA) protein